VRGAYEPQDQTGGLAERTLSRELPNPLVLLIDANAEEHH
jgi:hypothetical protein